ncbi:MAG: BTAD domain-containing putative transcriptional regulator [Acidimicrobiales bacterium]
MMQVRVLGSLEVELDGTLIELGTPRQRAVLAVLVLHVNQVVSVDRLIEELWGEEPPAAAASTLQAYISNLRRALEPGRRPRTPAAVLTTESPGYCLRLPSGAVDAERFEGLVLQGDAELIAGRAGAARIAYHGAISLWRGEPYTNFAYEQFAALTIERLRELRLRADIGLARSLAALGEVEAASALAAEVAVAQPLREDLRLLQMQLLYRLGRQTEALSVFEQVRRALSEDLGLDPGPELQRVQLQILNHDPALLTASTASPDAEVPPSAERSEVEGRSAATASLPLAMRARQLGPLIGRDEQLQALVQQWQHHDGDQSPVLIVEGPAGIGKTRLITEFATVVHQRGARILWGRCTPEPLTRYQPFVEALGPLAEHMAASDSGSGDTTGALRLLFPDLGASVANRSGDIDQFALFSAVTRFVRSMANHAPTVLVVEDAHWADSSTASLLVHLARHGADIPFRMVVSYRSTEVRGAHPAAEAMVELRRDRLVQHLALEGLDRAHVSRLVRHLHPTASDAELDVVHERTEGNPFFIEELVAAGQAAGSLDAHALPHGIRAVIDRRLDQLPERAHNALRAAAVLGREFHSDELAELTGPGELGGPVGLGGASDSGDLLDDLEAALELNLITELPRGRFSFAHALIRAALMEGMSDLRRRRLHRAAAEAIARSRGRAGQPIEPAIIAHHLLAAGSPEDLETAGVHLLEVAGQALAVFAFDDAARACRQVLDADVGALPELLRCDLLIRWGKAQLATGERDASRATLLQAAALARHAGDGTRMAEAVTESLFGSGLGLHSDYGQVDWERAALLEEALSLLDDPAMRVWTLSYLATVLFYDPNPDRRTQAAAEALALAEQLNQPRLRAAALIATRQVLETKDTPLAQRLEVARRAIQEADLSGELGLRVVTRLACQDEVLTSGDLPWFDRLLDETDELIAPLGPSAWRWFVTFARTGRLLSAGDPAATAARINADLAEAGPWAGHLPMGGRLLQRFYLELDQPAAAAARLEKALEVVPEATIVRAAACLAHAKCGNHERAAALLCDPPPLRDSFWTISVAWLTEAAVLLGRDDVATLGDGLLAGRDRELVAMGGGAIYGTIGRIRGLVARHQGRFEDAETLLSEALGVVQDLSLQPWVTRITTELHAVHAAQAGGTSP